MKPIPNPADVGAEYRPVPFWSWNSALEERELRRQVALMAEAGMGGFFMHARGGLETEYLSEAWMDSIRTAAQEGRARGLQPWAYDENGWPSGFAGGIVNGLGAEYRQKYLRFGNEADEPCRGAVEAARAEGRLLGSWRLEHAAYHAWYEENPYYVDTLNLKVAEAFIEATHARYAEFFPGGTGPVLEGFFTDEPQISRNGLPWSQVLADEYRAIYQEELLDRVPELFLTTGDWARTRRRFFRTAALLHARNFLRPMRFWLEARGMKLTGHQVSEETFESQMTSNGAVMPHYLGYTIPGMDWLGRSIDPITTPLQVSSVAAQTGAPAVLSESFALCGWHVSLAELRWIFEWQMVHGITLLCPHLSAYTLRGIRKRDYPPSIFFQQPWWPEFRRFSDLVSRIGRLLADGKHLERVLVLHGQSGAWAIWNDKQELRSAFSAFIELSDRLDASWIPFHYGDEIVMEQLGAVDRSDGGVPVLTVGEMAYEAVVIPQRLDLSPAVLELLSAFARAGGRIVAVRPEGSPLMLVDGRPDDRADALLELVRNAGGIVASAEAAEALLYRYRAAEAAGGVPNREAFSGSPAGTGRLLATVRELDDLAGSPARLYYIVNTDRDRDIAFAAEFPYRAGSVERFDPETGALTRYPVEPTEAGFRIEAVVPAMGSLVLAARPVLMTPDTGSSAGGASGPENETAASDTDPSEETTPSSAAAAVRSDAAGRNAIQLSGRWEIVSADLNALPLDLCDILIDGEPTAENESVTVVQHRLMELGRPVDLELRFRFFVEPACIETANDSFTLAIETPERFSLSLNGTALEAAPDGSWYRDPAFRLVPAAHAIVPGRNTLSLKCRFTQPREIYERYRRSFAFESEKNKFSFELEIETPYLLGDFSVETDAGPAEELPRNALRISGPFRLGPRRTHADHCDPVVSGFPFLAGSVRFARTVVLDRPRGLRFRFDRLTAIAAKLFVNGYEVKTFLWKPFEAEIDRYLVPGENLIELEVTGSLRNLLGPLHLEEGESWYVGPFTFYKEAELFVSTKLKEPLPWNDRYCVVKSGLEGCRIE